MGREGFSSELAPHVSKRWAFPMGSLLSASDHSATGGPGAIAPTDQSLNTDEGGGSGEGLIFKQTHIKIPEGGEGLFEVKLMSRPKEAEEVRVSFGLNSPGPIQFTPAILTFTRSSWDAFQKVEVRSTKDNDVINDDGNFFIEARGTIDGHYRFYRPFPLIIVDDESNSKLLNFNQSGPIREGHNKKVQVSLAQAPRDKVDVALLSPNGLIDFGPLNWPQVQSVERKFQDSIIVENRETNHTIYYNFKKVIGLDVIDDLAIYDLVITSAPTLMKEGESHILKTIDLSIHDDESTPHGVDPNHSPGPCGSYYRLRHNGPNSYDPLYPASWHLDYRNTDIFTHLHVKEGLDLNIPREGKGEGIRIAISDSRSQICHPDLRENILPGESRNYIHGKSSENYIGDPSYGGPFADRAHGTMVAGVVVARDLNNIGSRGVAPRASFAAFNFVGGGQSIEALVSQAHGEFDIFNQSWGVGPGEDGTDPIRYIPRLYLDQLKYGVNNLRSGKGAIYVKSAGNGYRTRRSGNADPRKTTPYTINVSGVNPKGEIYALSTSCSCNFISGLTGLPSERRIMTTDLMGCPIVPSMQVGEDFCAHGACFHEGGDRRNANCDYTSLFGGTSAATPMVSGGIALILEANPSLTWRDVRHILISTARYGQPLAPLDDRYFHPHESPSRFCFPANYVWERGWVTNSANYKFHNRLGFGLIDIDSAVKMAQRSSLDLGEFIEKDWQNSWELDEAIPEFSFSNCSQEASINVCPSRLPDARRRNLPSTCRSKVFSDAINVLGPYTVESVQVRISITHPQFRQLGIELTSPSGTKSILLSAQNSFKNNGWPVLDFILLSNAFYGEDSEGDWILTVIDPVEGEQGVFHSWGIKINGRYSDSNVPFVMSPGDFCGGNGTELEPFRICTPEDIFSLAKHPQKNFILMNNIDMEGAPWETLEEFKGTFDGRNFQIANLGAISSPHPFIRKNSGVIKNVIFKDSIDVVDINEGEMTRVLEEKNLGESD